MTQRRQQKDVLTRLTETGEEALQKLVELPGGTKVLEAANALRERVDDLTSRVRSLDPLEKRVAELEQRLAELSKPKPTPKPAARSTAAKKTTPQRRAAAPKKKPAS